MINNQDLSHLFEMTEITIYESCKSITDMKENALI